MSHIRLRACESVRALPTAPDAGDLAILKHPDFAGAGVTADDVTLRAMLLCNDQYDRTFERFPKAYLQRFAETLPGKSVLPGHNKDELPLARFYRAAPVLRRETFPVLIQPGMEASDGKGWEDGEEREAGEPDAAPAPCEPVPGFAPRRRSVTYLQAGFYYPKDDAAAALDNRIRLGVYRSVSIGFRFADLNCDVCKASYLRSDCPHLLGQKLDDGLTVTGTYAGDAAQAEALEGSLVFLGAQPQARLVKRYELRDMLRLGAVDPERLAATEWGPDPVAFKEAEALAREHGHARKSFPAAWAPGGPSLLPPGATFVAASSQYLDVGDNVVLSSCTDPFSAPAVAGTVPPASAGPDDPDDPEAAPAGTAAEKETPMSDTQKDALTAAAADLEGKLKAAVTAKESAETELKTARDEVAVLTAARDQAEAEKTAQEPLAAIGAAALTDLKTAILDDDLRLSGAENAELADLVGLHVERRNYPRLRELAGQKRAAVLEKFPPRKGDAAARGNVTAPASLDAETIRVAALRA